MINVGLLGHDGRNPNLGVGALTISNIKLVHEAAKAAGTEIRIFVLAGRSSYPSCVSPEDATEMTVRPLRRPWMFFKELRRLDLIIDISGGDSFSDIYGPRRISQILYMKFLAIAARRPVVMAPQTIGPFENKIFRTLAAVATRHSQAVFARDEASMNYAREVLSRPDCEISSDVAMCLPFEVVERKDDKIKIGINISGLLLNGGYSGENMFRLAIDYEKVMHHLLAEFMKVSKQCEVHLVAHVVPEERGGPEDDYQACLSIAAHHRNVTVAPAFKNPSEAKTYISGMDLFIGARMHACIAAFSTNVPVLPIAYSRKFAGLFGSLGYDWTVDCKTMTEEEIVQRALELYSKRKDAKILLKESNINAQNRLNTYRRKLSTLFSQIESGSEKYKRS